jgi:hypothetical protein
VAVVLACALIGIGPWPVSAGDPVPYATSAATLYRVTFAARECDSYANVTADRVVDDSAESATKPGRASVYRPGQAVDPDVEAANSAGCRPITGWRFTMGSGHQKKGALSTVTDGGSVTQPTLADTPRLDPFGRPNGTIAGAVTVALTDDQLRLIARRSYWAQGGTPDDPLGRNGFRAKHYGFGALRCGIDGRTGGNLQWLAFPPGARHAYCFAYYVRDSKAGSITVRVRPTRAIGYPQRFPFNSNLSFSGSGDFAIASSGDPVDATFTRLARTDPYVVQARIPDGWRLASLQCAGGKAGAATTDVGTARASVTLAADDAVVCTYTVDPPAVGPGLTIRVQSDGGSAAFGLTVEGAGGARALSANPAGDGSAATAGGADLTALPAGPYTVTITPPDGEAALWSLSGVSCNGKAVTANKLSVGVSMMDGVPVECAFRVARKAGSLALRVVTLGTVGTAAFVAAPDGGATVSWAAGASTGTAGVATEATGDLPKQVPFGSYEVTAIAPPSTVEGGWRLTALSCDSGDGPGPDSTVAVVPLTPSDPTATCTATYDFTPATRLQVLVHAEGSPEARTASAVVQIACDDGSAGALVLNAKDFSENTLPEPLSFLETTSCTVSQPSTGAVDGATVTTSVGLNSASGSGTLSLPAKVDIVRDVASYTLTVTDKFTGTGAGKRAATFPGPFRMLPMTLVGAGLIGIGALILLILLARRRSTRDAWDRAALRGR